MDESQLSRELASIADCGKCLAVEEGCNVDEDTCARAWLNWLNEEVKE